MQANLLQMVDSLLKLQLLSSRLTLARCLLTVDNTQRLPGHAPKFKRLWRMSLMRWHCVAFNIQQVPQQAINLMALKQYFVTSTILRIRERSRFLMQREATHQA